MSHGLTPRQRQIVEEVRRSWLTSGCAPTLVQLGRQLGISKVTVHELVGICVRKGALVRAEPRKARSLSLAPMDQVATLRARIADLESQLAARPAPEHPARHQVDPPADSTDRLPTDPGTSEPTPELSPAQRVLEVMSPDLQIFPPAQLTRAATPDPIPTRSIDSASSSDPIPNSVAAGTASPLRTPTEPTPPR